MRIFVSGILAVLLALILGACGGQAADPGAATQQFQATLDASVQATLAAQPTLPLEVTSGPTDASPSISSITGRLGYPADHIPEMVIVAFQVGADGQLGQTFSTRAAINQQMYELEVPAGSYQVVGYTIPTETIPPLAGGYADEQGNLITFTVDPGGIANDVNVITWPLAEGKYPPNPVTP